MGKTLTDQKYKDKEFLIDQYENRHKSIHDIAIETNTSNATILRWFDKFDIETRPVKVYGNKFEWKPKIKGFFLGTLLGDGCLAQRTKLSSRYAITQKNKGYLSWIDNFLSSYGIKKTGHIRKIKGGFGHEAWMYESLNYRTLQTLSGTWYPDGKKIIPQEITLSPLSLRHWYIEDGSFYANGSCKIGLVSFHTQGFQPQGRDILVEKLSEELEINQSRFHINNEGVIRFGSEEAVFAFFNYIAPLPKELEPIYGYKWPN